MKLRSLFAASLLALLAAAPSHAGRPVTVKGSDTMVILGQRWAEAFMNQNAGQVVMVTGGGSGTGIAALINGTTDVCQSSRPMKPDEKLKLRDRFQTTGVEIPVAKDGLSVYLHEANPVKDLSIDQLRGSMDLSRCPDPGAYERANYIHILQGWHGRR